jgi:cellulose synthase/poly-beta-1,6-N-acetylglucosamine synthase-like glycosyltransferase
MSRSKGHINVLSGAGTFLRVGGLREVANSRGTRLPGTKGEVMLAGNIVEDYELTCAIRELGYQVTSSKRIQMFSDIMPTWRELEGQRIRWYRGTIETIWLYGLKPYVRFSSLAIAFNLLSSAVLALAIFFLIFGAAVWGAEPDWRYLIVIPLFMAEYVIVSRLVPGRLPKVVAWTFLPMFFYGAFLTYIYWKSLIAAIRKHEFHWDGINVSTKNGDAR